MNGDVHTPLPLLRRAYRAWRVGGGVRVFFPELRPLRGGGEFLARLRHRRKALSQALSVSRSIFEMTDALWDTYRDALEQADAYSALSKG